MTDVVNIRARTLLGPFWRWWSYRDLVRNLVSKEIKVRYQGAVLGFAWSLMNPLMITLMYLFVFTYVFRSSQPNHALYMVTGIVHWTLFSTLVTQAPEQLVGNADLLKKIYFPRLLVPLSNLLVNSVLWFMALVVFLMLYGPLGGKLHWALLVYPFYLLLFLGFAFGLMLILCVLYVDFRDLKHLVEVFVQLFFWTTPIIYPLSMVPARIRDLFLVNPLTEFTHIFQDIFWAGQLPSWQISAAFSAWAALSLGVGLWLFYRRGAKLIERL
ncbi:ABC transporter permease [Acidihalobacter prosperus]|uniref:ABC transporter permease n=1 Tax=Acidihalobacter prosperus TaxID=160660 RepID=UPI000507BC86|nr:ABC transporter permease [Acidihalobacter prosperus]